MSVASPNLWMLPEGIEDLLPPQAALLEEKRQRLLALFASYGYRLVIPPLMEYCDSLLVGSGRDLDLKSFKLIDQISGRMMAIRADMTPQVARIDAQAANSGDNGVNRYCYFAPLLQALPDEHGGSRSPIQVGAELFGQRSYNSDIEIIRLMIAALHILGVDQFILDLGHVGIYRALSTHLALNRQQETTLFAALQRKSHPDTALLLQQWQLPPEQQQLIFALLELHGDISILESAEETLAAVGDELLKAVQFLRRVARHLETIPGVTVHIDLAELRGFHYHTDTVFCAYFDDGAGNRGGRAIAQGGRYDAMGAGFGCKRPATGFSLDMRSLLPWLVSSEKAAIEISAPPGQEPSLLEAIAALRQEGQRVVQRLTPEERAAEGPRLERVDQLWQVVNPK
ncbi:MAG: ATP phosphoribosyltransferase regulatory subunit [Gammaproteobacteria bacterium]|nr:ATP phosphoribosyltransferase regulatory subunit [Gammaproteobacteria bacterium]